MIPQASLEATATSTPERPSPARRAEAVMHHLAETHHRFTYDTLVEIERLVARALTSPEGRRDLEPLLPTLRELEAILVGHLLEEERLLFPAIRRLSTAAGQPPSHARQARRRRKVALLIENLDLDHAVCRRRFADLARLTRDLAPRAATSPVLPALHTLLAELETDLTQHLAIEERVLFPAALAL
jgi:regulator of cell morphogenesis and NO signaling